MFGRWAALAALAAGLGWLGWRVTAGSDGVPWWLVGGWSLVEAIGLFGWAVLVWALWPDPSSAPGATAPTGGGPAQALVVVRCDEQPVDAVAATVMAAGSIGPVTVLDVVGRDEVRAYALGAGAGYVVPQTLADRGEPLVALASGCTHELLVLLDAGDVAAPDIVDRLVARMGPGVAVVQGAVAVLRAGSAGRVRPVLDLDDGDVVADTVVERRFEPQVLNPALGARGVAHLTGSGALVRTAALAALRDSGPESAAELSTPSPPAGVSGAVRGHEPAAMEHARLTIALFAAGWQVTAVGGPPVVVAASADAGGSPLHEAVDSMRGAPVATDPIVADRARAVEASAARLSASAALRRHGSGQLGPAARLSLLAWSVQPLAGIRRSVLIGLVVAAVLAGTLPFAWSLGAVLGLWAPWFCLSALSVWWLSSGAVRPGSGSRAAMLCLGPSWRGVATPNGAVTTGRHVLAGAFGFPYGTATAAAIVAVGVVVALRGLSERVTHTLAPMPTADSAALLVVALWAMASGLSALRLLTVRRLSSRAIRVATSLFGTFGGRPVLVVDLSPTGAAIDGGVDAVEGEHGLLEVVIPTSNGCVSAVVAVEVRDVRDEGASVGGRRLGLQFVHLDPYVRDALIEFCRIQPLWQGLVQAGSTPPALAPARPGSAPVGMRVDAHDVEVPARSGLRMVALVAVVGAAVSVLTPSTEAAPAPALRSDVPSVLDATGER
jgi:hypothetical protein